MGGEAFKWRLVHSVAFTIIIAYITFKKFHCQCAEV